jgi:hypothetical protein
MKNKNLLFLALLATATVTSAFYFTQAEPIPDFQTYEGLLFYDNDQQAFYLEDMEAGTDILLKFKYEESSELDFDNLTHVEVHGMYQKDDNSLRVLALHETTDITATTP